MTRLTTVRDQAETTVRGIQEALQYRLAPATVLTDNARRFAGCSLLEMGREFLAAHGVNTRGMDRMTLAAKMLTFRSGGMTVGSDLPSIVASAMNKRLRDVYTENPGTYRLWARRGANAPDFKSISVVQLSAMPDLLQINEHGEFKYGAIKDQGETYSLLTYGRIVGLSRQLIVNDDVRALARGTEAFATSAGRLENRLAYAQLHSNPLMADGLAVFEATTHKNLATGAPSALQFSALTAGRTAMRVQTGQQGEELNLAPSFLIVPAALESAAYQLTSAQYTPATQSNVSEFRAGGRTSLEPVVEPILDSVAGGSTAWYLAAQNSQVDTVEYCFLDGFEAPYVEAQVGFDTDGVKLKCRHDFAAKVIDYRGLYKAAGA